MERFNRNEDSLDKIDSDYEIWWLIHVVRTAMYAAMAKELSRYPISPTHAAVLFIIDTNGGQVTPAEISRWLFRKPHSVHTLLGRMENSGLIVKQKDVPRRHLISVSMTDKGRQFARITGHKECIGRILSLIPSETRQILRMCLECLRYAAFEDNGNNCDSPFPPTRYFRGRSHTERVNQLVKEWIKQDPE